MLCQSLMMLSFNPLLFFFGLFSSSSSWKKSHKKPLFPVLLHDVFTMVRACVDRNGKWLTVDIIMIRKRRMPLILLVSHSSRLHRRLTNFVCVLSCLLNSLFKRELTCRVNQYSSTQSCVYRTEHVNHSVLCSQMYRSSYSSDWMHLWIEIG